MCGGVLIGQGFVLTAAQCCKGATLQMLHFGLHFTENTYLSGIYQDGTRIHPNFDEKTLNNDICLIHFSASVEYGPRGNSINNDSRYPITSYAD
jgi:hypothetical protein